MLKGTNSGLGTLSNFDSPSMICNTLESILAVCFSMIIYDCRTERSISQEGICNQQ